jgi:hypothetical protein
MKKVFLFTIFIGIIFFTFEINAQYITNKDLEKYDINQFDENGDNKADYIEAANYLKSRYELDANEQITRITVVEIPNMTKEQLYQSIHQWFLASFVNGESVLQFDDKEAGIILGKGFLRNIAQHFGFGFSADISAWVLIRVEIKGGKYRLTTIIQSYELMTATGVIGVLASTPDIPRKEEWLPSNCYPFNKQYKKTASKAFVFCHLYSMILAEKLENAVKNGITGTENDAW